MYKIIGFFILIASLSWFAIPGYVFSFVIHENDKVYIQDLTGERWDVIQAKTLGFEPRRFQFGIGRNAFIPLDGSDLSNKRVSIPSNLRIIGVVEESEAQAYSIQKLGRHEIANSRIGSKPIVVGY